MSERNTQLGITNVRVVNTRDIDVVVRDCYGVEHLLFPKEDKQMSMLTNLEKSNDHKRTGCRC